MKCWRLSHALKLSGSKPMRIIASVGPSLPLLATVTA